MRLIYGVTFLGLLVLGACSSSEPEQSGFNQIVPSDGATVSFDGLGESDVSTPLDDGGVTDGSTTDGLANDVVGTDGPSPDGSTADGASEDTSPGDADAGDEDASVEDASVEDASVEDVPAGDAPGPDAEDVAPQCVENQDCVSDPESLAACVSVYCINGQCAEAAAKSGTACELSDDELAGGCTVGVCDESGTCVAQVVLNTPCEDGDPCTTGEVCGDDGVCAGGSQVICTPPGPCQAAVCDSAAGGCVPFPSWEGQPCNDLDPCTTETVCAAGECGGGDNQCICETDEDCPDDGDLCNGTPVCTLQEDGGKACELAPGSTVSCEASENPCVSVSCAPETGECVETSLPGLACQDGDLCTLNDTCNDAGQCVGTAVICEDEDPCTEDNCAPVTGTCFFDPATGPSCSDGNLCTTGDACESGVCQGAPKLCDDANACTVDSCEEETGSCFSVPNPEAACDDGNACTDQDSCNEEGACSGAPISCEDDNPCTGPQCDPLVGCLFEPLLVPCDDGDACTGPDVCSDGVCENAPLSCDDGNACTVDSCDSKSGCAHEPDDEACDDGNPCTSDSCDLVAGCIYTPLSDGDCDDESACTLDDTCSGGACVGVNLNCDDGIACTLNSCDPVTGCTVENDASKCDDSNPCTDDSCDPESGCLNLDNESGCDDGSACTEGDLCTEGVCQPGANSCSCDPADVPDVLWSAAAGDGESEFYGLFAESFNSLDPEQELVFSETSASLTGASYTGQVLSVESDVVDGLHSAQVAWHLGGASIEGSAMFLFWEDAAGDYHDLFCVDDGLEFGEWGDSEIAQIPYDCGDSGENFNVLDTYTFDPDEEPKKLHLRMFMMAVPTGDTLYVYELGVSDAVFPSAACDDDNLCNGVYTCAQSLGEEGECQVLEDPVVCDEELENPCLMSACDPATGACTVVPVADGVSCQDSDPCTTNEVCQEGVCTTEPTTCDDGIGCTTDTCDSEGGGCVFTPENGSCDDGVECTENTCDPTKGCVYTPSSGECDDDQPCTKDVCDLVAGCSSTPVDSECDDGVACTVDSCSPQFGCVQDPDSANCGDGNPCTNDVCLGGEGCVHTPTPGACSDGNPCTIDDACSAGICTGGPVNPCESSNSCETGQCDPATGSCAFSPLGNGTACEDGDACSNPDVCQDGLCEAGPEDSCDDGIACTVDSCEPSVGCVNQPQDASCDDGNPCTIDTCEPGAGCQHAFAPEYSSCTDGLEGTGPDVCVQGVCTGFQTGAISYSGDWFCSALDSVGRALGVYSGEVFAVLNHEVDGFWCGGARSQVVRLSGASNEGVVVNSTIDEELTAIAHDGVFAIDGSVGQFVWGVISISYNLGDLIDDLGGIGSHYAAWAGDVQDGDAVIHRTYVAGENQNGDKGRIRRCVREADGDLNCGGATSGLKKEEKEAFRPIAIDGAIVDNAYVGIAAVSNDVDDLASVVWSDSKDDLDYALIPGASEILDVARPAEDSIWVAGDQGYVAHFDTATWSVFDGPPEMQGLDLTTLGHYSGHVLVAGHWSEEETGEAFLFALPAGADGSDAGAWMTVPLGVNRQVHAMLVTSEGLTLIGRHATPETQPEVYIWYLNL